MIVKIEGAEKYGIIRQIDDDELGDMSGRGWKLIAIVMEEVLERFERDVPNPNPPGSGYHYEGLIRVAEYVKVQKAYYIVGLDQNAAVELRTDELGQVRARISELTDLLDQSRRELKALEGQLTESRQAFARLKDADEEVNKRLDYNVTLRRKPETDLAKIRIAMGEIKFKEIVG